MVNLVAAHKGFVNGLMKMAGITPHTIEIEPGTTMSIWIPTETTTVKTPKKNSNKTANATVIDGVGTTKPTKPVVVLVHGFASDGVYTWQFQVGSLTKKYSVYVPDLLFFGGSITDNPDRSPTFQAECLVKGLMKLGIDKCTVVGFSYGGVVAFKMAELYPKLVEAMVIMGAIPAMTDSICKTMMEGIGFSSLSELLLPVSVKLCRRLLKVAVHIKLWIPDFLLKDYLEVMFSNRKERAELLEGIVVSDKDTNIPHFSQRIHLIWGEKDQVFKLEYAQKMKEQLGCKVTLRVIKKAGHLLQLERPCVYNRCLKQFLATIHADDELAKK